jgi:tetratricopeptide (TPR) repeat protein
MDIRRHLNNEVILARPPSKLYEFQKTVRRHKVGFAATAAIILVLAAGVTVTSWQAIRATQAKRDALAARHQAEANEQKAVAAQDSEAKQRRQAEANEKKAEQVAHFMQDMLQGVGPSVALGRDTKLLREILDQTAQRLEELKGQPEVEADLRATVGQVYRDLSDYTQAETMLRRALELRRQLHGEQSLDTADAYFLLSDVLRLQGRDALAENGFRQALEIRRKQLGNKNAGTAASLYGLAEVVRRRHERLSEAEGYYREALKIQQSLPGHELEVARTFCGLGVVLRSVAGNDRTTSENLAEAEKCLRDALQIQRVRLGEHPETAYTLSNLGYVLKSNPDKRDEGERVLREAVAMQKKILGDHRDTAMTISFLATTVTNLAESEALHREALTMRRKVLGENHSDTEQSVDALVKVLQLEHKDSEAQAVMRESLGQMRATEAATDEPAPTAAEKEKPGMTLAEVEKLKQKYGANDSRVASALARLAYMLTEQDKFQEAEPFLQEAVAIGGKLPDKDKPKLIKTLRSNGSNLNKAKKYAEAEAFLQPALAFTKSLTGITNPEAKNLVINLASVLRAQHKFTEALVLLREYQAADSDPRIVFQIATTLSQQQNTAEAADLFRQALNSGTTRPLSEQSWRPDAVNGLCSILAYQEKFAEAEAVCRAELALYHFQPGHADSNSVNSLARLAHVFVAQGKTGEAQPFLADSLAGMENLQDKDKLKLIKTLRSIGANLHNNGKSAEAEIFYRPALKWSRTLWGSTNAETASAAMGLHWVLLDEKKFTEALAISREFAEAGNASACYSLGWAYANGEGVEKNEAMAVAWWRKAATSGHRWAGFLLAECYASGQGVMRDDAEAVRLYRKCVRAGAAWRTTKLRRRSGIAKPAHTRTPQA